MSTLKHSVKFDINIITPTRHRQLMNMLLRAAMEYHKRKTLGEHFQPGAARKYGYRPLTKGYAIRKTAKLHENIPMVYTGRLRDLVKDTSKVTATATKSTLSARGYFPMPDYLRGQVEAVTPEETKEMAETIGIQYAFISRQAGWKRARAPKVRG